MQNQQLKEGKTYPFTIVKHIDFEGESFYVLSDLFGKRHMLDASFYKHYGFTVNMEIRCLVDKINCTGRIYLEPEHPTYHVGNTYRFVLIKAQLKHDVLNEKIWDIHINDHNLQEFSCQFPHTIEFDSNQQYIDLCVYQLKKGKVKLMHPLIKERYKNIHMGNTYTFKITNEITHEDKVFFVLEDSEENKHLLNKQNYQNYNLLVGQSVACKVVGYNHGGRFDLEPAHPVYKENKIHEFEFVKTYRKDKKNSDMAEVFIVKDIFGNELFAPVQKSGEANITNGKTLFYRVKRLKKGKPVLEAINAII